MLKSKLYILVDLTNIIEPSRELDITGALKFENCKFENCHFTVTAAKENKRVHVRFFFCHPLIEDKIVYIIQSRRSFCASPSYDLDFLSVFNLWPSTKRFTSTLNDIIYAE
jgi:hypothetical protein